MIGGGNSMNDTFALFHENSMKRSYLTIEQGYLA